MTTLPASPLQKPTPPPPTPESDTADDFHGTLVPDPYRWLENAEDPQVQAWTKAHNERTRRFLDQLPALETIKNRLSELWDFPKYGVIHKAGGKYFTTRNDGLQNQPILYRQESLDAQPTPLLDPNSLSQDGSIALIQQSYSQDGNLLGYSLSSSGSDWQEIHILDTNTGEPFEEVLKWCKYPGIAWTGDNKGFFYNRLTQPDDAWGDDTQLLSQVYRHILGQPQANDTLIYQDPDDPGLRYWPFTTEDHQYLILHTSRGTDRRNGIYLCTIAEHTEFQVLVKDGEAKFVFAGNQGSIFYFLTDLNAPLGRIITIDVERPARENWCEILPESSDAIAQVQLWGERLVVVRMHHAYNRVEIYTLEGQLEAEIALPTMGTVSLLSGDQHNTEIFLSFESFLYPRTIFRYDLTDGDLAPIHDSPVDFDAQAYQTQQVFYASKDGTRMPMFLTHNKDLARNGTTPTILYGYGGFTLSQTPFFNVWNLVWLEMGGMFALANLRGGTEYGEAWHQAGMLGNKQNVFDDFITAAEWLIAEGYTSTPKLAIEGRSNGGLLTAATMVQRPDLFGAVLCWVPVTDMLRFHKFTVGYYWTPEYGNAEENPEHFRFLYTYSPLHNLKTGVSYPPTIVTTGDTDTRVVPAHSKKFVAALLAHSKGEAPHLLRIDLKAGHKDGKPTHLLIREHADVLAFAAYALNLEVEL